MRLIPVSKSTFCDLYTLKDPEQTIDDLISVMIQREWDLRDWKRISEIDRVGEFIPFNPEEMMQDY